jgi:hypothetical protein
MHSFNVIGDGGANERHWEVIIRRKGTPAQQPIRHRGPSLSDVMSLALDQAEAEGWPHSPAPHPDAPKG